MATPSWMVFRRHGHYPKRHTKRFVSASSPSTTSKTRAGSRPDGHQWITDGHGDYADGIQSIRVSSYPGGNDRRRGLLPDYQRKALFLFAEAFCPPGLPVKILRRITSSYDTLQNSRNGSTSEPTWSEFLRLTSKAFEAGHGAGRLKISRIRSGTRFGPAVNQKIFFTSSKNSRSSDWEGIPDRIPSRYVGCRTSTRTSKAGTVHTVGGNPVDHG